MKKIFALLLFIASNSWAYNEQDLLKFKALNACERCDLSGADLTDINFRSIERTIEGKRTFIKVPNLKGSNLKGANLKGANLSNANLEGADLREANLEGADLREAFLLETNLAGANLDGASLGRALIGCQKLFNSCYSLYNGGYEYGSGQEDVSFSRADLRGAILGKRNFSSIDFSGADLRWAILKGVNLSNANLEGADLREANLEGADLREANLEGVNLSNANLEGADLREANLEGAELREAYLYNARLDNAKFCKTKMPWGEVNDQCEKLKPELEKLKPELEDRDQYKGSTTMIKMTTSIGDILIELYQDDAPISSENFKEYVKDGFYNDTIFHRVVPNFLIQGGGMTEDMVKKPTRGPIKNEAENGKKNLRGTLAMASKGVYVSGGSWIMAQDQVDFDTAESQFFINLVDNNSLDHGDRDFGYAVFGEVIEGMDVVDKIASFSTNSKYVPIEPIIIRDVVIVE